MVSILEQVQNANTYYYFVKDHNKIVCSTLRAGSVSMRDSLDVLSPNSKVITLSKEQVLEKRQEGTHVLMWIRDPFERITSAYKLFKDAMTVEEFADEMLRADNLHWMPQIEIHSYNGIFLPSRVYPFDRVAETWKEELPNYALQWNNKSKDTMEFGHFKAELSKEKFKRIFLRWHTDYKLYSAVMQKLVLSDNYI